MRKPVPHILVLLLFVLTGYGQVRVVKPIKTKPLTTKFSFFCGIAKSELILERNIHSNNAAFGYHGGISYGFNSVLRGTLEYVQYRKLDIMPTWSDIRARTFEINLHYLARLQGTPAYFYPITGISYNIFNGFFTGMNDYLNLADRYARNDYAHTRWLGANLGLGFEYFFKPVSIFGEFKMRAGLTESHHLSVLDVYFGAGFRYNLSVPSIYKMFRGTRSRYMLRTPVKD
jgi:hypothetical protein